MHDKLTNSWTTLPHKLQHKHVGMGEIRENRESVLLVGGRKEGMAKGESTIQRFSGTTWEDYGKIAVESHWPCIADGGEDEVYLLGSAYTNDLFQKYNKVSK